MNYLLDRELAEPPSTEADSDAQSTTGSTATSMRSITYKDHDVLHQKYQKVKRYYFEQQAQIQELKEQGEQKAPSVPEERPYEVPPSSPAQEGDMVYDWAIGGWRRKPPVV